MNKGTLDKILDDHKLWLKTNGEQGIRANLSHVDLYDADLSHVDLYDADLRYANLYNADLRYANLSHVDLYDADLSHADLRYANLRYADLRYADLRYADLRYANLDFSAFPLWCGGLDVHIDDRQATQLLYHLVRNVKFSKNTSAKMKKLCELKSIVKKANEFHRVNECGEIVVKGGDAECHV